MKKPESKWILEDEDMATWKCPQCGWVLYLVSMTPIENKYHYCPNCGVNLIDTEGNEFERHDDNFIKSEQKSCENCKYSKNLHYDFPCYSCMPDDEMRNWQPKKELPHD